MKSCVGILLILNFLVVSSSSIDNISSNSSSQMVCPPWTVPDFSSSHQDCVCGDLIEGAITCNEETKTVYIDEYYCVFFSEIFNSTLIGSCPYGHSGFLPKTVSDVKDKLTLCSHLHRRGQLCGECIENYTLPAYSYYLGCVRCKDFKNGWIKFIAAAFLPLTAFYIIVVVFRIPATSTTLNGYVLVSQIIVMPAVIRTLYTDNQVNPDYYVGLSTESAINIGIAVYAIWNLDFFRSFYEPFCLRPNLTYPQVLLLDYAVALYPLLLIFVTLVLVKLHDNYAFVVQLWRPFHKCLTIFRKQWNIQSSLVNALATFIVLSYIKILNVSLELLMPSQVYNIKGHRMYLPYLYYNGSIVMTSEAYRPYLIVALSMLLIFNVLPLMLLAIYPFGCFQKFLGKFWPCLNCKISLQIFMDAFHGCYENTGRDYRHFATLYLVLRFVNPLLFTAFDHRLYLPTASVLLTFTIVLVAKFQPYKHKRSNTIDIVIMLAVVCGYTSMLMRSTVCPMYTAQMNGVVAGTSLMIPFITMTLLAFSKLLPVVWKCLAKTKNALMEGLHQVAVHSRFEETPINRPVADYHTLSCND